MRSLTYAWAAAASIPPDLGDDVVQCRVDVLGHSLRVTTDIHVCPGLKPVEELRCPLPHAVLHIRFRKAVGTVAGERNVETGERARVHEALQLVAVEEVSGPSPVPEEQP